MTTPPPEPPQGHPQPGPPPQGPPPPQGQPPQGGYGPPPPGYAPPPTYGQPPPPKSNKGWLLGGGGALIVLIAVGLTLFFVLRGGDGKADASSPTETVESYLNAAKDDDTDAGLELLTDELRDQVDKLGSLMGDTDEKLADYDIGEEKVDGDKATVDAHVVSDQDNKADLEFQLVKDGDDWKIEGFPATNPDE